MAFNIYTYIYVIGSNDCQEAKICCSRSLNRGPRNLIDRDSCSKGLDDSCTNYIGEKNRNLTFLFKIGRSPRNFDITTNITCYFMCGR